jgi:hypothetical protein
VFALLVLDRLKSSLSKSKRDQPLAYNQETNRREPMNRVEKLVIGLIMVWFRHVPYAIDSDEAPPRTIGETIAVARAMPRLVRLLGRIYENPGIRGKHLTWILDFFVCSYERGASGERSVGTYYRAALNFILDEIERVAGGLDVKIEDLFGFIDDDSSDAPELAIESDIGIEDRSDLIEDDSSEIQPLAAAAEVELDWHTRLSQFKADYGRYDLQEVGRLLDKEEFFSDWVGHRQVHFPESESETEGDAPHTCFLQDLCEPGRRIALVDQWGSGTAMALLWLSKWHCSEATDTEAVVLRIDAKRYAMSAAGESPYRFLARRIYGTDPDSFAKRKEFEEVLRKARPIGLVHDLSKVSHSRQETIAQQLSDFSGVVFTADPKASDEKLIEIGGEGTIRAELAPLELPIRRLFVSQLAERHGPSFDAPLASRVVERELPETASFPGGLNLIGEQVLERRSDCASITARLIEELYGQDGQSPPQWDEKVGDMPRSTRALLLLAVEKYEASRNDGFLPEFNEQWARGRLGHRRHRDQWPEVEKSPLLVRTGLQTHRFFNQEILGFLAAMGRIKGYAPNLVGWRGIPSIFQQGIDGIVHRHYLALLEREHP